MEVKSSTRHLVTSGTLWIWVIRSFSNMMMCEPLYIEVLYVNMKSMKWQVKKGALVPLGLFAKHQQEIVKFGPRCGFA